MMKKSLFLMGEKPSASSAVEDKTKVIPSMASTENNGTFNNEFQM
jgi:hypothetical protein